MTGRRRSKRFFVTHFDNSLGFVPFVDSLRFVYGVDVLYGRNCGMEREQPGALILKQFSDRYRLAYVERLPFDILFAMPVVFRSVDLISGNFDKFSVSLQGWDNSGDLVDECNIEINVGDPFTVLLNMKGITRFRILRRDISCEVPCQDAVTRGGRIPKGIFFTNLVWRVQ